MSDCKRGFCTRTALTAATTLLLIPGLVLAQAPSAKTSSAPSTTSAKQDRWLHVRVISSDAKGRDGARQRAPRTGGKWYFRPSTMIACIDGKVKIDCAHLNDVDLRAMVDAIRTAKDGEYVTVQGNDNDVRVAKQDNHLIIHVLDKGKSKRSQVEIKVPMKVIDALFSAGKDELDLVAALHALSGTGDTELVSVKADDNTVRVWLDSKNVAN